MHTPTPISSNSMQPGTEAQLTLFPAVSPASPLAQPENKKEVTTTGIYGRKCSELSGKCNQPGLLVKMCVELLHQSLPTSSTVFAHHWKVKVMKYNRYLYQLQRSELRTKDTGFGLLPTPQANCSKGMSPENVEIKGGKMYNKNTGQQIQSSPEQWAKMGLLPTPIANDAEKRGNVAMRPDGNNGLAAFAANGLLPTPTNSMVTYQDFVQAGYHSSKRPEYSGILPTPQAAEAYKLTGLENQDSLTKRLRQQTGKTSQLNPLFVMEMMGFPANWTLLPFLSGETNPSKPEETQ